jgi:hypothetical protein
VGLRTQLPAGVRLQASAPFRAKEQSPNCPCLRRETLGGLEAGAVNTCGLFDIHRIFDETDVSCSSELAVKCAITSGALVSKTGVPHTRIARKRELD